MPGTLERELRALMGIPETARRVVVFSESSHWDPDWLLTSGEYYALRIRKILDRAIECLLADPRRVFSIESVFFLKMYWEGNPKRRDILRDLANEGRIRFSGTGFTQPDTTIPSQEAIIRDFLLGRGWLRENGFTAEPKIAYMTDDFGLSPAFPSTLSALGLEYAAASRIDGHYFAGTEHATSRKYPLQGSSAELMLEKLGTADVVWRGPDSSEVLFHLNVKDYDYGGRISMLGIARWMDIRAGIPARSGRHVKTFVNKLMKALCPYCLTPYVFCPIGGDFNSPIRDLSRLLDGYNRMHYPESGVWLTLASLEDYMDLVSTHREVLPVVTMDPNPNFMGFYFSRPGLKAGCRRLAADLLTAEKLDFVSRTQPGADTTLKKKLARAWEAAVVTNHHDFITGTAPRRVYEKEQMPMVREAGRLAREGVKEASYRCGAVPPLSYALNPPRWRVSAGVLRVESAHYTVEIDGATGGCLTSFIETESGSRVLGGPGNDLVLYADSGGLWRLGCEFSGGRFDEIARASESRASVVARETVGVLHVLVKSVIGSYPVTRELWFANDSPLIWGRTSTSLGDYRTLACGFATASGNRCFWMDVAGGVIRRPAHKVFTPTFFSAQSFCHRAGGDGSPGFAVFTAAPGALCAGPGGEMKWIVARNAKLERAYGFLPVPSFPARGPDDSIQVTEYAVMATGPGGWRENGVHLMVEEALWPAWRHRSHRDTRDLAATAVRCDTPDVRVEAVKQACDGNGTIVRLLSFAEAPVRVELEAGSGKIIEAHSCDALERNLGRTAVAGGRAVVQVDRATVTVRLIVAR